MKNFKMNDAEFRKTFHDESFVVVGYSGNRKIFVNEVNFIICIEKHADEFDFCEFEENEVLDIDFMFFALKWCKSFISPFKTIKDHEESKKVDLSNEIGDFIRSGYYGQTKVFENDLNRFEITIVPGGAIYHYYGTSPVFVPYSEVEKELALKESI